MPQIDLISKGNRLRIEDPHVLALAKQVVLIMQLSVEKAIAHNADPVSYPISENPESLERVMLSYVRRRSETKLNLATRRVLRAVSSPPPDRERRLGELAKVDLRSPKAVEDQVKVMKIPKLRWPDGHLETLALVNNRLMPIRPLQGSTIGIDSMVRPRDVSVPAAFTVTSSAFTWQKAWGLIEGTHLVPETTGTLGLPQFVTQAITSKYEELGGAEGVFGEPIGEIVAVSGGIKQDYEGGSIFWSFKTGAHGIRGAILDKWYSLGAEGSFLGYPISDTKSNDIPDKPGNFNYFENGAIYWSEGTGAHEIHGAILFKWEEVGAEKNFLGYPVTDETETLDKKGRFNHFQGGSIFWTADTGAHTINGSIRDKWASVGWERSFLGYPITDSTSLMRSSGGVISVGGFNHFEHGSIYSVGSEESYLVYGAIRDKWASLDREQGFLGFPITDELGTPDGVGRFNHFQGGSIYWSPETGACEIHGAIRDKWESLGWETGYLGYPVTDECDTPDKIGRYNHFQGGSIYWTHNTGAHAVNIKIQERWASLGWENGYLGYPLTDTSGTVASTLSNDFQGGFIRWTQASGAQDGTPFRQINFKIARLDCLEETGSDWAGSDEIFISGVGTDDHVNSIPGGTIKQKADSGKNYLINRYLFGFPLDRPAWPKGFMVTILLMEDEGTDGIGGLTEAQQKIIDYIRDEVKRRLQELGIAVGESLGPLGVPIGALIGIITGLILGELIDWIAGLFDDQWFPPAFSVISLPSVHVRWNGSTFTPAETHDFSIPGGHYLMYTHWEFVP